MKAHQWIDRLKVAQSLPSDYAVAKLLKMRPSAISNYRARNSTLDDESALKVAMALEIDPVIVLADQATERSKDEAVQTAWHGVLVKLMKGKEKTPSLSGISVSGAGGLCILC